MPRQCSRTILAAAASAANQPNAEPVGHAEAIPVVLVPEDNSPHGVERKITLIAAAPEPALAGAASLNPGSFRSDLRDAFPEDYLQPRLVQLVGQAPDRVGQGVERFAGLDARVLVDDRVERAVE